jgi:IclR family KDG regulon transcriptional repressor
MKTIKKAFMVLNLFLNNDDGLTLEDMAMLSGLNRATVRRIASTLIGCGYLRKSNKRGKYFLGWTFLEFSGVIKNNNNIIQIATPHLIELRQQVNETVSMAIWDGMSTSLCQSFVPSHMLRVFPKEGSPIPLHATSIGKAIIAELSDEQLQRYFSNHLESHTPNTITNLNDLKKHLMIIRHEGVSFDDEEYTTGVRGLGAALKGTDGSLLGAFGIFGPSVRLTREKLREYVPVVKKCAIKISSELGYEGK